MGQMPRFRVIATSESQYIADIEAETAAEAATVLGDRVRSGEAVPVVGPAIAHIEAIRLRDKKEDKQ